MSDSLKARKGLYAALPLLLTLALSAALAWYYNAYVNWRPKVFPYTLVTLSVGIAALTLLALWARGERKAIALLWKTALSLVAFTGVSLCGVSYVINNIIGHEAMARQASMVALPLAAIQILALCVLALLPTGNLPDGKRVARKWIALAAALLLVTVGVSIALPWYYREKYRAPEPKLPEGKFAGRGPWGDMADFRVSPDGMSIEEARDLIREARAAGSDKFYSVEIAPGEYNIKQIVFDERDYGTLYSTRREEDEAVLNGGMKLNPADFAPWEKNKSIQVIDLTKLGLGPEDWGKMYSFGGFTTASMYDDGVGPLPCELFFNSRRCTIARWPDEGWLEIGKVLDNGDSRETYQGGTVRNASFDEMRNPRGGAFEMDAETARRAAGWASLDDVWMFGCFKWDWADMSTPVKAINGNAVTTEYASGYGFERGRRYYFYNVLEELDAPGEWYLDREKGLLYFWPPEGDFADARIDISLSADTLIQGTGLKNVSLVGLTLQGTRGDGMSLSGDDLLVDHCVVRNLAGSAITLSGYNNTASNNEVYRVGKQGITVSGGEAATLTPGNSKVVNNLVHDWSEVVMTYQGGVNVYGTGNLAAHNELYNSRHTAMFFGGNNNVIEYNYIHDVCLETDDAGAIYAQRSFYDAQGTVVRYNVLVDIGRAGHTPCGIYLDAGLSGVSVLNNLLVNVPDSAIAVSGRDLDIRGNIVVNAGKPVNYDQRMRDGALAMDPNVWFQEHTGRGGDMWPALAASPWQTDIWKAAFPKLAAYSTDFADIEKPEFAANPAGSSVTGNVFAGPNKPWYDESVLRFSEIGPNKSYGALRALHYWDLPGYEDIPLEQIGRVG